MKIIVFSDSHGKTSQMLEIIQKEKHNIDCFIHLGDRVEDVEEILHYFRNLPILNVHGNNDYKLVNEFIVKHFLGLTFYITHGHRQLVNFGYDHLVQEAKNHNANVVLFGHTHKASIRVIDKKTFINPGSISFPRDGTKSYCIIHIDDKTQKITPKIIEADYPL